MTRITSTTVASSVNFTSLTDSRMVCARSNWISRCTAGGIRALKDGNSVLIRSTTSPCWCRLALDRQHDVARRTSLGIEVHSGLIDLDAIHHPPESLKADRGSVAISHKSCPRKQQRS